MGPVCSQPTEAATELASGVPARRPSGVAGVCQAASDGAAANHVGVAELAAVARIAADFLHRLVAHPLDQPDDVVESRIVVAVLGGGQQLGPQPLVPFEVGLAGRRDFVERRLLLLVDDLANRGQAIDRVGKGDAAAGEEVVLRALGHVVSLLDTAVEEARRQRRLAPADLGFQLLHLPLVALLQRHANVGPHRIGKLIEVVSSAWAAPPCASPTACW